MTMSVSSQVPGPQGLAGPRDGQRLAGSLRVCRLTTLYGAAGSGKTELLKHGVLPMLHRRATDVAVPHGLAPRVVIPFADRRRGPSAYGSGRSAEVAVYFSDWDAAPLVQMQIQVHEAMGIAAPDTPSSRLSLAGSLAALNMQFGARFLIILDQFEACVSAARQRTDAREFLDELVQAVNRPLLPVNFLIAVREEDRHALDDLRARVPGFDDQSLQLGAAPEIRVAQPLLRPVPASVRPAEDVAIVAPPDVTEPAPGDAVPPIDDSASPEVEPSAADTEEDWHRAVGAIVLRAAVAARQEGRRSRAIQLDFLTDFAESEAAAEEAQIDTSADVVVDQPDPPTATPPPVSRPAPISHAPPTIAPVAAKPAIAAEPPVIPQAVPAPKPKPAVAASPADAQAMAPWLATTVLSGAETVVPDAYSPAELAPLPTRPKTSPRTVRLVLVAVAAGLLLGYGAWVGLAPSSEPPAPPMAAAPRPAPAMPTPPAPVPAAATPPIALRVPAGLDALPRPLAELGHVLAAASPAGASAPSAGWPAGFTETPGAPGFAVARYDALQLARRNRASATNQSPLQTIAPLYTEELYFVARADSPLTYIHDIEGAAINAGPAGSSRAVTVAAVYQRLFDKPLQGRAAATWGADAALGQLLDGKGIDVIVLAGSQPAAWLANLPPASAQALKLLKLDRNHPADQRALQAYLPATLRAGPAAGTPSLAVMSFLVAANAKDGVRAAEALCAGLPELQQTGDPKWRELQPGLQLDAGWPAGPATQQAWRACASRRS